MDGLLLFGFSFHRAMVLHPTELGLLGLPVRPAVCFGQYLAKIVCLKYLIDGVSIIGGVDVGASIVY